MALLHLAAGDASVEVDPEDGGRLVRWTVEGLDLIGDSGAVPQQRGCYPMAPWAGRLRGNAVTVAGTAHPLRPTFGPWAIHGTVLTRAWEVEHADATTVRLATDLGPDWPWPGRAVLTWRLGASALSSLLQVESEVATFPATLGWHPWFRRRLARGGPVRLDLPATAVLDRGPDHLPTGGRSDPGAVAGPYDDAFVVPTGRATLTWPGALTMTCQADVGWYVVFDELVDWVCVEPQTGPPDGLGEGAAVVAPGRPHRATATWSWHGTAPD